MPVDCVNNPDREPVTVFVVLMYVDVGVCEKLEYTVGVPPVVAVEIPFVALVVLLILSWLPETVCASAIVGRQQIANRSFLYKSFTISPNL